MTYTVTDLEDGRFRIGIDFSDEDIVLSESVIVVGPEASALAYLPVFEADMRRNFNHLWPLPEPEPMEEEV